MTEAHWADPAYVIEDADGNYRAHTGNESIVDRCRRELNQDHPERAPHQIRETTFHEVNGTGPFSDEEPLPYYQRSSNDTTGERNE